MGNFTSLICIGFHAYKYCQSNNWWRFRKIMWPSKNIWTLTPLSFFYHKKVLQQLYNVPGLCDTILGNDEEAEEETILHQLQSVFGHLLSSKLKYHIPEKFWQTFRLFGQPVNVREQQDAFEFYTQIIDQVDEFLMSRKKPKTFPAFFEGIFSDQKICQECPHRFERYLSYNFLICDLFLTHRYNVR